ncbi:MAG: hypothetical protein Q8M31_09270 [Beijerinckiaceae bacterium]|nr:hypothetical protein [Beijerinckiaceae bacterium]
MGMHRAPAEVPVTQIAPAYDAQLKRGWRVENERSHNIGRIDENLIDRSGRVEAVVIGDFVWQMADGR